MTEIVDITSSEALREKIHELHNYMRNNGIGYGIEIKCGVK